MTEIPESDRTSIPKEHWGVHEQHCCPMHGCKYGDADCPVVRGLTKGIICEDCQHDLDMSKPKAKKEYLDKAKIIANLTESMISTSKDMPIELFMHCTGRNSRTAAMLIDIAMGEFDVKGERK